jgi:hypothetical protein
MRRGGDGERGTVTSNARALAILLVSHAQPVPDALLGDCIGARIHIGREPGTGLRSDGDGSAAGSCSSRRDCGRGHSNGRPVHVCDHEILERNDFGNGQVSGIKPTGSSCDTYQPTIPGQQYLVLIDSLESTTSDAVTVFPGAASVYRTESVPGMKQYLAHPKRVSRRDVLAMLHGWHDGTIADPAFARWLRDTAPVAEVDDWATFEEGDQETH